MKIISRKPIDLTPEQAYDSSLRDGERYGLRIDVACTSAEYDQLFSMLDEMTSAPAETAPDGAVPVLVTETQFDDLRNSGKYNNVVLFSGVTARRTEQASRATLDADLVGMRTYGGLVEIVKDRYGLASTRDEPRPAPRFANDDRVECSLGVGLVASRTYWTPASKSGKSGWRYKVMSVDDDCPLGDFAEAKLTMVSAPPAEPCARFQKGERVYVRGRGGGGGAVARVVDGFFGGIKSYDYVVKMDGTFDLSVPESELVPEQRLPKQAASKRRRA